MRRRLSLPILVSFVAAASPALAQDVSDLVGARGSSGEMELEQRGFSIAQQKGLTTWWWNPRSQSCVRVVTADGRYKTVAPDSAGACGQTDQASAAPASGAASGNVTPAQMPRFCKGAAAEKFGQSPQNISTQMPIPDHGMYSVFGQFPPNGAGTVFICTFTRDGKLVGVDRE
ncbi:hypothetical protein ACFB49_40100 [Sphingomonas sp. DBB INV C78]|uniref:hypothetical protein n=1 Tax=Sphingomonas sp. DBB INV C78 TaxID=3349434 RepID=UPI0036D3BD1F